MGAQVATHTGTVIEVQEWDSNFKLTTEGPTEQRKWTVFKGGNADWQVKLNNELASVVTTLKSGDRVQIQYTLNQKGYANIRKIAKVGEGQATFEEATSPAPVARSGNSNRGGNFNESKDKDIRTAVIFKGAIELIAAGHKTGEAVDTAVEAYSLSEQAVKGNVENPTEASPVTAPSQEAVTTEAGEASYPSSEGYVVEVKTAKSPEVLRGADTPVPPTEEQLNLISQFVDNSDSPFDTDAPAWKKAMESRFPGCWEDSNITSEVVEFAKRMSIGEIRHTFTPNGMKFQEVTSV